jgi:NitT/TauT family transport system substrate-binding protein
MPTHRGISARIAWRRQAIRRLAAAFALGQGGMLGCAPVQAAPALEKTRVTIAVGGKNTFYYLPLAVAEFKGYFKDEGLEVEVIDFAGGSRALQAVVGGSADVVSGAYEHTISLQAKKQYFTAFVLQGQAPQIGFGVSVKTLPNFGAIGDLRGKRIGVTAPGSSTNMLANYVLASGGVKSSEVSFIGVGAAAGALAAFRAGQIDAIANVDPVITTLERSGEIRMITDTRSMQQTVTLFGGPMPAGCLYAPEEFLRRYPRTVQALTDAMVRAARWLQQAGPSEIIKTVPESYLLGDRALYIDAFLKVKPAITPDGLIPAAGPATALRALAAFDPQVKSAQIDLNRTYTNAFVEKALARQR